MAGRVDTGAGQLADRACLAEPNVRRIDGHDLVAALREGLADFLVRPSHYVFLVFVYPVAGLVLTRLAFGYDLLHLVFPLTLGFAFIGPLATLGVFELSRRIERGEEPSLTDALAVLQAPARGAIAGVALVLFLVFALWLVVAWAIWLMTFGPVVPESPGAFIREVLTTPHGWALIIIGNAAGAVFGATALALGVFSLPMLVDGERSLRHALLTSVRATLVNAGPMALWGLVVAGLLLLGALPAFVGLIVVLPVLGHATWRLYRRVIER